MYKISGNKTGIYQGEVYINLSNLSFLFGRLALAIVYYRQNDLTKAEESLRLVIRESPEDYIAYTYLANVLIKDASRLNEALWACEKAITIKSSNPKAYFLKIRALSALGLVSFI